MYIRHLEKILKESIQKYPVIALIGPRQSGKTTLVSKFFSDFEYVLLEEPDQRRFAHEDPRGFFQRHSHSLILDEAQHVPELLSYIQGIVDQPGHTQKFILTGSQHLVLMEKISQTLAGRSRILNLLPLSFRELQNNPDPQITFGNEPSIQSNFTLEHFLFKGGYPKIYDKDLNPTEWLSQYYQTYIERDVRSLIHITNLDLFDRFTRLCAGRVGQLLNLDSLGSDAGISQPTAQAWFSLLQVSFICYKLTAHFRNFSKRLIKTPKLYFYDTGLLCYLLRITTPQHLFEHPLRGAIFENWVISEFIKSYYHRGVESPLYFWRDQKGHEVDLVIDQGTQLFPIEIKSAQTFHPDFLKGPHYLNRLQKKSSSMEGACVYAGTETFSYQKYQIFPWFEL